MYKLRSIARRSTLMGVAVALGIAAILPAAAALAAELNPLTDRSLLLSSSAPGYVDTDGSGYSTGAPNPAGDGVVGEVGTNVPNTYAPAGSGPNGKKTGETFKFKTSTTGNVKAFTFQYCTTAAGKCVGPGNNTGDADPHQDGSGDDADRETNAVAWPNKRSDLEITAGFTCGTGAGQFQIIVGGTPQACTNWKFATSNKETADSTNPKTGKNNYITLYYDDAGAGPSITGGTQVEVVFKASESIHITNPGAGEFFVKLNTYDSETLGDHVPGNAHNIDGGVTVANVMTDSIHITTKVLETMSFSVGTRNRDTLANSVLNCGVNFVPGDPNANAAMRAGCEGASGITHGPCQPITQVNNNRLNLGDPDAEYSLKTGQAYSVYSYWRLSSNSSGGATVYYSGDTLSNTVGDQIDDMTTTQASLPGKEQFGLGFVAPDAPSADYAAALPGRAVDSYPFRTLATGQDTVSTKWDPAVLPLQTYTSQYGLAQGGVGDNETTVDNSAQFKFLKTSSTIPEPIAQQNNQVISCATAKMRYVANIAADTPAGVYTTKINYLAAPQY